MEKYYHINQIALEYCYGRKYYHINQFANSLTKLGKKNYYSIRTQIYQNYHCKYQEICLKLISEA